MVFISASTCGRFRSTTLKPDRLLALSLSEGKARFPKQNGIVHEIPSRVGISGEWIAFSEPTERAVKLFKSGKLVLSFSSKEKENADKSKSDTKTNELMRIPGRIVMGANDDFFVENYIPPESETKDASTKGFYKILQFDFKGKLLKNIGRKGQNELPFENLIWFDTDKKGRLWVLYRYLDELNLDAYDGNRLVYEIRQNDCEQILFDKAQLEALKSKNSIARCEYIYPFYSDERVMMAGRVDKIDPDSERKTLLLNYRIIKVKALGSDSSDVVFSRLSNPEDHPYLPQESDMVSLWQSLEPGKSRIARYNLAGSLKNSLFIESQGRPHEWRSIWQSLKGDVYGIRIFADRFEIHKFK